MKQTIAGMNPTPGNLFQFDDLWHDTHVQHFIIEHGTATISPELDEHLRRETGEEGVEL